MSDTPKSYSETVHYLLADAAKGLRSKPMSDTPTPRTDAWELEQECNFDVPWEDNCRQLERELAAANRERDDALMMLGIYKIGCEEQKKRIRRLEEAGDNMAVWEQGTSVEIEWRKAKEAKP